MAICQILGYNYVNCIHKRAGKRKSEQVAIISIILGGIGGFLAFFCSLVYFDFGLLAAMGMYLFSGFAVSTGIIANSVRLEQT